MIEFYTCRLRQRGIATSPYTLGSFCQQSLVCSLPSSQGESSISLESITALFSRAVTHPLIMCELALSPEQKLVLLFSGHHKISAGPVHKFVKVSLDPGFAICCANASSSASLINLQVAHPRSSLQSLNNTSKSSALGVLCSLLAMKQMLSLSLSLFGPRGRGNLQSI